MGKEFAIRQGPHTSVEPWRRMLYLTCMTRGSLHINCHVCPRDACP